MKKILILALVLSGLFIINSCAVASDDNSDVIEKFFGTWSVNDQASRLNYTVTIKANPSNSAEVLLTNFADLGTTAVGLVVGSSVVIDTQSLGSEYTVSGSGSYINSNKLEFVFQLNDGIDIESRKATFTK